MRINFVKSPEKRKMIEELEKFYGIKELKYLLIESGKQKFRAFSGHLSKEEISNLGFLTNIETIGMYMLNTKDNDIRVNFDALPLFASQINKSILELDDKEIELWIRGYDLEKKTRRGVVVIKFNEDLVGIGKSNGEKIFNYLPKERKLKTQIKN